MIKLSPRLEFLKIICLTATVLASIKCVAWSYIPKECGVVNHTANAFRLEGFKVGKSVEFSDSVTWFRCHELNNTQGHLEFYFVSLYQTPAVTLVSRCVELPAESGSTESGKKNGETLPAEKLEVLSGKAVLKKFHLPDLTHIEALCGNYAAYFARNEKQMLQARVYDLRKQKVVQSVDWGPYPEEEPCASDAGCLSEVFDTPKWEQAGKAVRFTLKKAPSKGQALEKVVKLP